MANEFKSGFVTFIGRPNVGKSTLMNRLIGQKIAITSSKPQTTRNRIQTVYTDERGQIIFLDTPGINKIDTVEEKDILEAIDTYKDVCDFAEIIPVSALKGKNTDDVIDSIYKYLDEGPMYFDEDTITDQPERQICAELIREKALRLLSQEIPHGIAVVIDAMKVRRHGHIVDIDATIVCERDSHKGIIIGKQGSMLKKIGTQARIEMENLLDMKVNLQLWVKVKKDWRDSDMLLKNYGYDKKEV